MFLARAETRLSLMRLMMLITIAGTMMRICWLKRARNPSLNHPSLNPPLLLRPSLLLNNHCGSGNSWLTKGNRSTSRSRMPTSSVGTTRTLTLLLSALLGSALTPSVMNAPLTTNQLVLTLVTNNEIIYLSP